MARFLLYVGILLIILWLLGLLVFHLTTPVIHLLIAIGVILLVLEIFRSRRNWW